MTCTEKINAKLDEIGTKSYDDDYRDLNTVIAALRIALDGLNNAECFPHLRPQACIVALRAIAEALDGKP